MAETILLGGFYIAAGISILFAWIMIENIIWGDSSRGRRMVVLRGYDSPELYQEDNRIRIEQRGYKETDD